MSSSGKITILSALSSAIELATDYLLEHQEEDGRWQFPLEADCTITSDYVLLQSFIGHHIVHREGFAKYLLDHQSEDGSWGLYDLSEGDLSCTVRAYFALKLLGIPTEDEALAKARNFILSQGGAEKSNVFTRIYLALFGQVPWDSVPWIPVELFLLPKWFPINIYKMSYWSRTVLAPLSILYAMKPKAANEKEVSVSELFKHNPWTYKDYFSDIKGFIPKVFFYGERALKKLNEKLNYPYQHEAIIQTGRWINDRRNSKDGLGAIFPAIAFTRMASPYFQGSLISRNIVEADCNNAIRLLITTDKLHNTFVQPCISPVWDTSIAMMALKAVGNSTSRIKASLVSSADWLISRQCKNYGDWEVGTKRKVEAPLSGWAFQNKNQFYPDVDDTAMVVNALKGIDDGKNINNLQSALAWLSVMQSDNGGYGAFDVNNTSHWLNKIPFADHGAMLDPPTEDVSGRALSVLAMSDAITPKKRKRLIKYLLKTQITKGSAKGLWYGRWGTNHLWGTWSAIMGLKEVSHEKGVQKALAKAAKAINNCSRAGGWGESNDSYKTGDMIVGPVNAFATSLAILALCDIVDAIQDELIEYMAVLKIQLGIETLLLMQNENGSWPLDDHNAPGFPRAFYLKYHGYSSYFPLWALARAREVLNDYDFRKNMFNL